ncbi:hypothetical protein [Actinoplanes utahensis]|uniref:hypothetical protein n=1 Tax=Actinoplanes utahensis TaxID=1869 RepID=UPI00126A5050|nr:hypothetical protein [Actinoplanes utahensis]
MTKNDIFRIFPNSDGLPPAWTDKRYQYCRAVGAIPFISTKIDGDPERLRQLRTLLLTMEPWVRQLYLTDRHEPEDDTLPNGDTLTAARYKENFNALLAMVNKLPPPIRSRIRCGPVMTKQWTENKAGRGYHQWDPGTGDFYGVDAYVNSWAPGNAGTVFTEFPHAATWLGKIKAYRFGPSDTRPRILAELGAIQPAWDRDGSARAAFLRDVHDEVSGWNPGTTGWSFLGWIWWNTEGTSGAPVTGIGRRRWFQLDRRHNAKPLTRDGRTIDPMGGYDEVPTNQALTTYNTLARQPGRHRAADSGNPPGTDPGTAMIGVAAMPGTADVAVSPA